MLTGIPVPGVPGVVEREPKPRLTGDREREDITAARAVAHAALENFLDAGDHGRTVQHAAFVLAAVVEQHIVPAGEGDREHGDEVPQALDVVNALEELV